MLMMVVGAEDEEVKALINPRSKNPYWKERN
jgi:hypothetical protein